MKCRRAKARKTPAPGWALAVAGILCLGVWGCRSGPSSRSETGRTAATSASQGSSPGIDLNCVYDHLQNPTEAFHYSYKKDAGAADFVHEEADITPRTIDGSWENNVGKQEIHGMRSDRESWQTALSGLTAISGMSSAVAVVNHASATVREGAEKMNGYDTIRYSIDTARGDAPEQALYRMTMGPGGFEKGMAWVT
ncbi:MAG TPA: hypothetical protein VE825_18235, partial [Terriglobales bacterium]|nr:hypothetical protein [Terriglobales bacterium]